MVVDGKISYYDLQEAMKKLQEKNNETPQVKRLQKGVEDYGNASDGVKTEGSSLQTRR